MTSTADHSVNAARALRLALAALRANDDATDGFQVTQTVFDEIDRDSLELVAVVLAHLVGKGLAREHGPKQAALRLEKSIARLLDFAAPPASS